MREGVFFSFKFSLLSSVSAESVCSFFFQTSSFRKKDTKEREIPSVSLLSSLSKVSLSLSFSLSSVTLFLFDEREREKEARALFWFLLLFCASTLERERGKEIAIRLTPD